MHLSSKLPKIGGTPLAPGGAAPRTPRANYSDWNRKTGEPSKTLLGSVILRRQSSVFLPPPIDALAIQNLPPNAHLLEIGPGVGDALDNLKRAAGDDGAVYIVASYCHRRRLDHLPSACATSSLLRAEAANTDCRSL